MQIECACGAVALEVTAPPVVQMYCHCDDCQEAHGAAYVPESVYPASAVNVVRGEPGRWKKKRNDRVFCRDCGTRLYLDVVAIAVRGVNGALLPPGAFTPTFHMQCRFAVRPVADSLPHYVGRPAAFGGSDDRVDW